MPSVSRTGRLAGDVPGACLLKCARGDPRTMDATFTALTAYERESTRALSPAVFSRSSMENVPPLKITIGENMSRWASTAVLAVTPPFKRPDIASCGRKALARELAAIGDRSLIRRPVWPARRQVNQSVVGGRLQHRRHEELLSASWSGFGGRRLGRLGAKAFDQSRDPSRHGRQGGSAPEDRKDEGPDRPAVSVERDISKAFIK